MQAKRNEVYWSTKPQRENQSALKTIQENTRHTGILDFRFRVS